MDSIIQKCKDTVFEISLNLKNNIYLKKNTNLHNTSGDEVKEFDLISNRIFHKNLKLCDSIFKFITEEDNEETLVNCSGKYYVTVDPLDGSSNLEVNNIVGSIFCIYEIDKNKKINDGKCIKAAGYGIYGPSVQFLYSYNNNTKLYQLINNQFKLIKDNLKIPNSGNFYSCNYYKKELYYDFYLKGLKLLEDNNKKNRWSGCMVADLHRIILNGGIFIYPASSKYPNGKIRLLYEIFPFAFILKNIGGYGFNHTYENILDTKINMNNIHEKQPIILGSLNEKNFFTK